MVRFIIFILITGFTLIGAILLSSNTTNTVEVSEHDTVNMNEIIDERPPEENATKTHDQKVAIEQESNDSMGILSYFPLGVGYNYNFSYAMDSVGEAIRIIGQHDNRFLAYGNQGAMLAFYRIYEIRNNEIYIVMTVTEGGELYTFFEENAATNDFSFLEKFKTHADYDGIPYLSWPLEKGKTFGDSTVIDVGKRIQIANNEYETIVIRHKGVDGTYTDYYYAKGFGLIRCVFKLPSEFLEEPLVVDYWEF